MRCSLFKADCLDRLKTMETNSVDSIITDPPYGLGVVKDLPALLNAWMTDAAVDSFVGASGFLNQEWDKIVPPPTVWRECLRILKPGGYLLVFAGTRTQDLMGISIRLAGFQLRDEISYLGNTNWLYGTGYPKSKNLKPAHEPILMFRKPGKGPGLNIDECRIAWEGEPPEIGTPAWGGPNKKLSVIPHDSSSNTVARKPPSPKGRWPLNVVLSHTSECYIVGTKLVKTGVARRKKGGNNFGSETKKPSLPDLTYADDTGQETVDDWECLPDCPVLLLGDRARFFYCTKPSKKERNTDLPKSLRNTHPTVKPLGLLTYLCKLITPEHGTILDPYMGSGSTGVAARQGEFCFVGVEKDPEFFAIAEARLGQKVEIE